MKKPDDTHGRHAKEQTQHESHRLTLPTARRKSDRLIQRTVWFVPLAVLAVCFVLLYEQLVNVGPVIEIEFPDAVSVEAGKTQVQYKGIEIGRVKDAYFSQDLEKVLIEVQLRDFAKRFAQEGAQFWVVRPNVSMHGFESLETLTRGIYIEALPGTGFTRNSFEGELHNPGKGMAPGDMRLTLVTDRIIKLKPNAPLLYRGVSVGAVENIRLARDGTRVEIDIYVRSAYRKLVNSTSRFWYSSGIKADFGLLSGANIEFSSFPAIWSGAIAFTTFDLGAPAPKGKTFRLHGAMKDEWQDAQKAMTEKQLQPAEGGPAQTPRAPQSRLGNNVD